MPWTDLHAKLLSRAFERILGKPAAGSIAFVRCLTPDVVQTLAIEPAFAPEGWQVWRVADLVNEGARSITADRAVEMREAKANAVVLVVDTARAGAGMDGIYSAAREVDESDLFKEALPLAEREITRHSSAANRHFAELAVKRARGFGHRFSISRWTEFDFLCSVAADKKHPGEYLHLVGLWPVQASEESEATNGLDISRMFVDRLLGRTVSGTSPARRIESLRLLDPTEQQTRDLEAFIRSSATKPLLPALADLSDKRHLWVNNLHVEGAAQAIQNIELLSWRTNTGKTAKWSGLEEGEGDAPPLLILQRDADRTGDYSKLEVKWKARPENLKEGAVEYRVAIVTDMEEELACREVTHAGKKDEKCRFSNHDFSTLSEDALISAKVVVSVIGNDSVGSEESEEFVIRFGQPSERKHGGVGKKVRAFSEGLIELDDRGEISTLASATGAYPVDGKGFVLLRTHQPGKSFRVFRPPLIDEVDKQWAERGGAIGRWSVRVRSSGARAGEVEFIPFSPPDPNAAPAVPALWDRAATASRRMAERFAASAGGVGQIYDEKSSVFNTVVKEYLLAWAALLEEGEALLSLVNTVEVQSLSGRAIGLIVLPSHPLRVAWLSAYDNLVLHAAFDQEMKPKDIRDEFAVLDGAMFPSFLPGIERGSSFVFADTLGFHAVGMVLDTDREPKAAVAILARALGDGDAADDAVPTVGKQSATILGNEVVKYLECHNTGRLLHVHALRPGDGFTVARALGGVYERFRRTTSAEDLDETPQNTAPGFVLELYPSEGQRPIAGRFIAEAREKRRSGAGILSPDDQWMLESLSLPGGVSLPRLRWARKGDQDPQTAAHLAVAFDTFESRVVPQPEERVPKSRPLYAFGMLSFFDRNYSSKPSPLWSSTVPAATDGERHPSDRTHTERLARLQQAVQRSVARTIGGKSDLPALRTEVSPDKAQNLRQLHRLCDWVITLDRNAGIEYFDSPRDNKEIYDAYVIDCVPERQDLGCLQLITSTSNFEEVRNLLDTALDQMGLSRSRRNAEFLMDHLKALSGRLAIRLTGDKGPTSELIALALCHANCLGVRQSNECWLPIESGFFISADDVRDLMPPLASPEQNADEKESRPDLIYVSVVPRKGLSFQFAEIKYRKHLRNARSPETLDKIHQQVESRRARWDDWYSGHEVCGSFRAVRRAKLARVLRFYADKAYRHYLPREQHDIITSEIDRMIEKGADYSFAAVERADRGWVFCPEYAGECPMEIAPGEWDTRIFLFGPDLLPDSEFGRDSIARPSQQVEESLKPSDSTEHGGQEPHAGLGEDETGLRQTSAAKEGPVESIEVAVNEAPSVCFGADVLSGGEVRWPLTVKGNPHLLVAGLPGMGKTTCLLNLCKQMLLVGIRPIIFSYHQDIDEKLQLLVDSVRFIDFHGLDFNPLRVMDREARMAYLDVAGALRDIFTAIYPELGDIQGERIRRALKESFIEKGWDDPNATLADLREPTFKRFVEILRSEPKPDRGLRTLLSRLDELDDYGFFDLSESGYSLWESDQPIVIRIHTTQNDNLQKAFASLVFYGLYKEMFRRGIQDHITHAVVFDEAHRAAGLKLIPTMAKECRKYGISLVVASQEAKDFNVSLFSAIANYLVLRLTEADARALARNVSSSQQERVLVDKIKQMDRFRALYFCEGKSRPSLVALNP